MVEHKHTSAPLTAQESRSIRAAIYGRISTANHGQDVGMQISELRQFAAARGWQIANEYTDHVTGSSIRRKCFWR
jgi:DNA invertase Pin-like site-specific DNA recombinase